MEMQQNEAAPMAKQEEYLLPRVDAKVPTWLHAKPYRLGMPNPALSSVFFMSWYQSSKEELYPWKENPMF